MQYKVCYNGKEKGEAAVFTENGRLTINYSCPFEEGRVYKLYASLKNENLPLGIMLKNGNSFTYNRSLNKVKVGINGEKITGFYIEKYVLGSKATPPLSFSADDFEKCQWIDTPDRTLQNCIVEGGVLCCDFENTTYIAAELCENQPFALAPFFCLVTPVSHNGKTLAVMKLDGKNIPTYLNKNGENVP